MWDYHIPLDPRFEVSPAANFVMTRWIEESLQSDRSAVFVAEESPGALEGYCHAMIQEYPPIIPRAVYGYLSEIVTSRRREGIGSRLLEAAHEWLRGKRITYVEVNVSVKNSLAGAFWRKHGYSPFIERLRREL